MTRIFPSVRQIVWSAIAGIAAHPRIKQPQIYYPIVNDRQPLEEVKIVRYRTYDGIELQEPGLTCAVFPMYSSRNFKNTPNLRNQTSAVTFEPYTLGSSTSSGSLYKATYQLVVQLYYQDVAVDDTKRFTIAQLKSDWAPLAEHGFNTALLERPGAEHQIHPLELQGVGYEEALLSGAQVITSEIDVEINPGEEVLREYIDLLRLVLEDMPCMKPWSIKSGMVKAYDFPTSSWNRENSDIYFHTAWLLWELCLFAPTTWDDIARLPPIVRHNL